jgi:hypothetical protein
VGCSGRTQLLQSLGKCLVESPIYFSGTPFSRPGNLVDYLWKQSGPDKGVVSVQVLWDALIEGLQAMWPTDGRTSIGGLSMGDVWSHS